MVWFHPFRVGRCHMRVEPSSCSLLPSVPAISRVELRSRWFMPTGKEGSRGGPRPFTTLMVLTLARGSHPAKL
jgi:hypothetical protein